MSAAVVRVTVNDDAPDEYALEEFCAANEDDGCETSARARALAVGESFWDGGGAAPRFRVERIA